MRSYYNITQHTVAGWMHYYSETLEELKNEEHHLDMALAANYHYQAWARDHNHYQVRFC